jgi:hypothetical protein
MLPTAEWDREKRAISIVAVVHMLVVLVVVAITEVKCKFRILVSNCKYFVHKGGGTGHVPWYEAGSFVGGGGGGSSYLSRLTVTTGSQSGPLVGGCAGSDSPYYSANSCGASGQNGFVVIQPVEAPTMDFVWTMTSAYSNNWQCLTSSADGTKLVVVDLAGGIFSSIDGGVTWNQISTSLGSWAMASSADGKSIAVGAGSWPMSNYPGSIYTTSDGGNTWIGPTHLNAVGITYTSTDGTKLAAVVYSGFIYLSADSGLTWYPTASVQPWRHIASSADGSKLSAVTENGIWISVDSGGNWTQRFFADSMLFIASSGDGTRLAAINRFIYMSVDSGMSWMKTSAPELPWWTIASSADGIRLVASSNLGYGYLYFSADGGINWKQTASSLGPRSWDPVVISADGTKLAAAMGFPFSGNVWTAVCVNCTSPLSACSVDQYYSLYSARCEPCPENSYSSGNTYSCICSDNEFDTSGYSNTLVCTSRNEAPKG